jgi:hypothetical protein
MLRAVPVSCLFAKRARRFCPWGLLRKKSVAASEKAHVRWALPIFLPDVPRRVPPDSWLPLTRRHYDANACPLGNRSIWWMS